MTPRSQPALPLTAEDRECLGRMVRQEWVAFAMTQPHPKSHHLWPWELLDEDDKEVDRRIGERLYLEGAALTLQAAVDAGDSATRPYRTKRHRRRITRALARRVDCAMASGPNHLS